MANAVAKRNIQAQDLGAYPCALAVGHERLATRFLIFRRMQLILVHLGSEATMTQHARDMANALRLFTSAQIQIVSERSFEGGVEQSDALEQFNAIDHEIAQIVERTEQLGRIRAAQDRM